MKEINGYLLVEVPMTTNISKLRIGRPDLLDVYGDEFGANTIQLPKGNYSIIGLGKDLTEEQWKGIAESEKGFGYRKYDAVNGEYQWTARALQSGHSLLKANNLNPNTTLILKQVV